MLLISGLVVVLQRIRIRNSRLQRVIVNQEKDKIEDELDFKKKDLESFAIYFMQKNRMLEDLKDEVSNIDDEDFGLNHLQIVY